MIRKIIYGKNSPPAIEYIPAIAIRNLLVKIETIEGDTRASTEDEFSNAANEISLIWKIPANYFNIVGVEFENRGPNGLRSRIIFKDIQALEDSKGSRKIKRWLALGRYFRISFIFPTLRVKAEVVGSKKKCD